MNITDADYKKYKKYFGVIYKIEDLSNGKVYIGQTRDIKHRLRQYRYEASLPTERNKFSRLINQALREKGMSNFSFIILEACNTLEELNDRELYWILKCDSCRFGYNTHAGGGNTFTGRKDSRKSDESIEKMKIPIITYNDGEFCYYESAQLFGRVIGMPRTHITRAAKRAVRVKDYFIFYHDSELLKSILSTIDLRLKSGDFKKSSDIEVKERYLELGKQITRGNVEIIRKLVILM